MDPIIESFAKKVNMTDFLESEPTKLSGGQNKEWQLLLFYYGFKDNCF